MDRKIFRDCAEAWLRIRHHDPGLRPRTHSTNAGYVLALNRFFGEMSIDAIQPHDVRRYQADRIANPASSSGATRWKRCAKNSTVNHEISAFAQILKAENQWVRLAPYIFPLPVPAWSPREILTEAEEEHLFRIVSGCPQASLAYLIASITNNTTAAGSEIRLLRIKHLFLDADCIPEIYIPADAVKNGSRPRKIPLNATAQWAFSQCYLRALDLGATEPDHYIFPFRIKRNCYDPSRPASPWFLRKSWEALRRLSGFYGLNPHDLRHLCITRMLECGVAPETVRAIAGHVGAKMMEYYSHQRSRVKYEALRLIERKPVASAPAPQRSKETLRW